MKRVWSITGKTQIPQEQLSEPKTAYHQGHCKKRGHRYLRLSANPSPHKRNCIPKACCDIAHQKGRYCRSCANQQTAGSKELYVAPANASPAKQIYKSQETACQKGAAQPVNNGGSGSGCQ